MTVKGKKLASFCTSSKLSAFVFNAASKTVLFFFNSMIFLSKVSRSLNKKDNH